jgi:phosphatidylglycerol:prolipoprotein diacylglycerol transferase
VPENQAPFLPIPVHAVLVAVELIYALVLAFGYYRTKKLPNPAAFLVLAAMIGGHVYYALALAGQYPTIDPLADPARAFGNLFSHRVWDIDPALIGPKPLPWNWLFVTLEVAAAIYLAWYFFRHKTLPKNEFILIAVALLVGGHIFYTLKLQADRPTFDLEIRFYGVFFAIGLLLGARALPIYFVRWGYPRKHGEELCLWTPIGMILGAHFIHMIFYETDAILRDPIRLFQIGSGLASHGGGLGAIIAVVFFARRNGIHPMKYMDAAMCGATWVIPWVRIGNFFNSEIVGRPWNGPWSVRFPLHDCAPQYRDHIHESAALCARFIRGENIAPDAWHADLPFRHPSQIYEAVLAFIMVGIAVYLQAKWRNRLRPGAILFILLAYYFTTRFLVEFVKNSQGVDDEWTFTMGQALSIPIALFSYYMLFFSKTSNIRSTIAGPEVLDNPPVYEPPKALKEKEAASEEGGEKPAPKAGAKRTAKKKKKKG